jgi:hypothetical protein
VKANRVGTCHKCGGNGPVADLPTGQALCAQCFEGGSPPPVSASAVIELRKQTGFAAMKCKIALEANGGDFEKAKAALYKEALDRRPRAGDMIFALALALPLLCGCQRRSPSPPEYAPAVHHIPEGERECPVCGKGPCGTPGCIGRSFK